MKELPFNPDGWFEKPTPKQVELGVRIYKLIGDIVTLVNKRKEWLLVEVLEEQLGRVPTSKDIVERCRKEIYPHPKDEEVIYLDGVPVLWIKVELNLKENEVKITYRK